MVYDIQLPSLLHTPCIHFSADCSSLSLSLSPKDFKLDMEPGDMALENEMKNEAPVESPTSVLEDEYLIYIALHLNMKDVSKEEIGVKLEEEILLDAKNGDSSLVSRAMADEEEKLQESRVKEEGENHPTEAPRLNDTQFTKLDELLTQTQLYSKFLLEKMDAITVNGVEEDDDTVKGKKGGRGSKRKAATNFNNRYVLVMNPTDEYPFIRSM
ncbi:hypothetical protein RHMOL_Rhmol08G0137000 [Rhododendron molle]|uniref:Uncharacterized protein n=1 Tax=Rhododendron molle TaxID=49168 RepID=A0ACC0MQ31_RHOML|nr:hypothetical protein RHMOL_Rhmol08G0137000 [Rhododendron molle]